MACDVAGFRTMRLKFDDNCASNHVLYFKKHNVREEESTAPTDKTLFVVNVPPYCDKVRRIRVILFCAVELTWCSMSFEFFYRRL